MPHDTPLITMIVAGLVLAYIFGMIAQRLKLPPLVGYLFAGIAVGPYTPGFVADQALGAELAELGVILLMFGVGLHFSLKDLMSVRALAIPGALVQIGFATLLGLGLASLLGWGLGAGLLFGLALSVASTVVLLKALEERRLVDTERGRIAVGWLIVEDLAMVLALVLVPVIAGLGTGDTGVHDPFRSFVERLIGNEVGIWGVLGLTLIKIAAFIGFMLVVGRRIIPWMLHGTAHTGSRELFRLAVLAIALGVALGSAMLFGVSLALGAFFAGMILSESELSQRAAQETLPLRDAFAVLFFVSIGMLFDPMIIVTSPLPVLATVAIIVLGKSAASFLIILLFRRPLATALTIPASLAQIGAFSFIVASMGVALAILPREGQDLILAGALISIMLNPLAFWVVDRIRPRLEARSAARKADRGAGDGERIEPASGAAGVQATDQATGDALEADGVAPSQQTGHTVLVGFGRVGRVVGESLHAAGAPLVLIEDNEHHVALARALGIETVLGHAARSEVLALANLAAADCLLIAIPDGFEAGSMCEEGRRSNPAIRIIARAHSEAEEEHLRGLGADVVISGEHEIGLGMLAWLRGERQAEPVGDAVAVGPKLPPVDNLLEQVAARSAMAAAAATATAAASTETPDSPVEPEAPAAQDDSPEPAEIAVVEAKPVADVIILPAPTTAIEVPPATLQPILPAPSGDDSPGDDSAADAAAAEAVPADDGATDDAAVAAEIDVAAEAGPAPATNADAEPAEPVAAVADAELAQQKADEVSEGGPAPAPADEDRPAESVAPEVLPEPKG